MRSHKVTQGDTEVLLERHSGAGRGLQGGLDSRAGPESWTPGPLLASPCSLPGWCFESDDHTVSGHAARAPAAIKARRPIASFAVKRTTRRTGQRGSRGKSGSFPHGPALRTLARKANRN